MTSETMIKKANGEFEPFKSEKLKNSLRLAGASKKDIQNILNTIEKTIYHGITTKKIYKKAFSELKKKKNIAAISYSLNEAVKELGPTGFPFERFVARVFSRLGYEIEIGLMMQGMCIEHEIDFLAKHESHTFIAETKFHNDHGIKSDLQTALYVKARFDDLWESPFLSKEKKPHSVWLITNTKFTKSALKYGECAGITMISWNYPKKGNLQELIEKSGLHPLTAISSLSKKDKTELLKRNLVLCREIIENPTELNACGLNENKIKKVINEAKVIIDSDFHEN